MEYDEKDRLMGEKVFLFEKFYLSLQGFCELWLNS